MFQPQHQVSRSYHNLSFLSLSMRMSRGSSEVSKSGWWWWWWRVCGSSCRHRGPPTPQYTPTTHWPPSPTPPLSAPGNKVACWGSTILHSLLHITTLPSFLPFNSFTIFLSRPVHLTPAINESLSGSKDCDKRANTCSEFRKTKQMKGSWYSRVPQLVTTLKT